MNLIILIFAFFTALGVAYDKLARDKHKSYAHKLMIDWWYRIGNTKIPDFKNLICEKVLNSISFLTKFKVISWQYLVITAVISWCLTSICALYGSYLAGEKIDIPYYPVYVVNYPFDLIAIIVTVRTIKIIIKERKIIKIGYLIFRNLIITYFLSLTCVSLSLVLFSYTNNSRSELFDTSPGKKMYNKEWKAYLKSYYKAAQFSDSAKLTVTVKDITPLKMRLQEIFISVNNALLLKIDTSRDQLIYRYIGKFSEGGIEKSFIMIPSRVTSIGATVIFGSLSTFIPILFFFIFILITILSRNIAQASKMTTTFLLDRFTESAIDKEKKKFQPEKFNPGTLTGILLGTISAILILIKELLK